MKVGTAPSRFTSAGAGLAQHLLSEDSGYSLEELSDVKSFKAGLEITKVLPEGWILPEQNPG